MATVISEQTISPIKKLVQSARYLVDTTGAKTDVVLPLAEWETLMDWLEDLEDKADIQAQIARLEAGPLKSGALPWQEVAAQWDDDAEV